MAAKGEGRLVPHFVAIRNTSGCPDSYLLDALGRCDIRAELSAPGQIVAEPVYEHQRTDIEREIKGLGEIVAFVETDPVVKPVRQHVA